MKINILLCLIFISLILIASENNINDPDLIGGTELNGNGCVCHSLERDTSVDVWIEGPDSLYVGQTGIYKMFLSGGPAEAGGYNVAGRFGIMELVDSFSYRNPLALNELTQAFSLPFSTTEDTIYWEFGYVVSDSSEVDTIYSCGLSLVWDLTPDSLDRWNFGPKFPITVMNIVPVELSSFSATTNDTSVILKWKTVTELNNRGFELQRMSAEKSYTSIAFIPGKGTKTNLTEYSYTDRNLLNGSYTYRLKQIDLDGSFTFSEKLQINIVSNPVEFNLSQNYPNPFNPSTKISWHSPVGNWQTLKIYDLLGNKVATLVDEYRPAGSYIAEFNAHDFASGVYYYSLEAGAYVVIKKMILLK